MNANTAIFYVIYYMFFKAVGTDPAGQAVPDQCSANQPVQKKVQFKITLVLASQIADCHPKIFLLGYGVKHASLPEEILGEV